MWLSCDCGWDTVVCSIRLACMHHRELNYKCQRLLASSRTAAALASNHNCLLYESNLSYVYRLLTLTHQSFSLTNNRALKKHTNYASTQHATSPVSQPTPISSSTKPASALVATSTSTVNKSPSNNSLNTSVTTNKRIRNMVD